MKINVEFDLTPDEFRRSLGLPDVEVFQQDLLNRIHKQMESGAEGYDPMSLMQPFLQQQPGLPQGLSQGLSQGLTQGLSQGLSSFGTYQQMMLDMLNQAASKSQSKEGEQSKENQAPADGGEKKTAKASTPTSTDDSSAKSGSGKPASSRSTTKATGSARSRSKREDA